MAPSNLSQPANLRQAWADYIIQLPRTIGQRYEYWGHLTYRKAEEIPSHHAQDIVKKRFDYFTREINTRLYGKRWMRQGKGVFGAMAIEKHKSGYPHHHFIMGGEGLRAGMRRLEMMDMWFALWGFARIWDYAGDAGAIYITKYVSKGGIVDVYTAPGQIKKLQS